jgi:hypothetical protein
MLKQRIGRDAFVLHLGHVISLMTMSCSSHMFERADSPQHTIDLQHYGNHQKSTELIAKLASEVYAEPQTCLERGCDKIQLPHLTDPIHSC